MEPLAPFPASFRFGAATAAYQIEGAHDRDGKAPSVWDHFCTKPGKIADGTDGRIACGHYDRLDEDLDLIQALGLQVYRFSISWPRVLPEPGQPNPAGIGFYDRLIDGLLERGITPMPTLHHWDMPQAIYRDHKGWRGRDTAQHFADYAALMARQFADRLTHIITLNEPWEHSYLGYVSGEHAPGEKRLWNFLPTLHHQLLGHGLATRAMRAQHADLQIGITLSMTPIEPRSARDTKAAERLNEFVNFAAFDPVFLGHYPADMWRRLRLTRPRLGSTDMETISTPVDFVGLNNYSRAPAIRKWWMPFLHADSPRETPQATEFMLNGIQHTSMGWEVHPPALGQCLRWIRERYDNPPTWITENGMALADRVENDRIHDDLRIAYLHAHLQQVQQAISDGSDMRGYLVWSLMDNFEWALGQSKRFGLIHVDYETLTRRIKDSGYWLRDLIGAQT